MDERSARLLSTTNAAVWAEEWADTAREIVARGDELIDEGWMIGWFANAMVTAEWSMVRKQDAEDEKARRVLAALAHVPEYEHGVPCVAREVIGQGSRDYQCTLCGVFGRELPLQHTELCAWRIAVGQ